jgi:hypothetical protein
MVAYMLTCALAILMHAHSQTQDVNTHHVPTYIQWVADKKTEVSFLVPFGNTINIRINSLPPECTIEYVYNSF